MHHLVKWSFLGAFGMIALSLVIDTTAWSHEATIVALGALTLAFASLAGVCGMLVKGEQNRREERRLTICPPPPQDS